MVLAKHPIVGEVKTRLGAAVGPDVACELYRAFVLDLAARLRRVGYPVWWAFAPAGAPFARLVGSRRCFSQRGKGLGARLVHATARVFAATPIPVIALGADAPHVPIAVLHEATGALVDGADVVLGPARDGGYYLIGLRRPLPDVFRAIPWSSRGVLAATRARCRRLRLRVHALPMTFDVDGIAELDLLAGLLARGEVRLPRTRRAMRRLVGVTPIPRAGSPRPVASPSSGCDRR